MECITHFSHQHPLNPFQLDDFEDVKPYKCAICGLPILHTPSYTCSADCKFFLHEPCTKLPQEFFYDSHSDTLRLMLPESRQSFSYRCIKYDNCEFEVHPLAAKPALIKSKHTSHVLHPLIAFCRQILSLCDGCGEVEIGFFFHCQECNFWIHQDCTVLPAIAKLLDYPHTYILVHALPMDIVRAGHRCSICDKPWLLRHVGAYICEDFSFAHLNCAKSKMESIQTVEEIVQLPNDEGAFPSLMIRKSLETQESSQNMHHEHPLILEDGSSNSSDRDHKACCDDDDLVCDACTQPIISSISPFYRCQSDGCHFVAHKMCADNLPSNKQILFPGNVVVKGTLSADPKFFFNSIFVCLFCHLPSNGFSYTLFSNQGTIEGVCDVECYVAPKAIKHASHRQHLLFQMPSDVRLSIKTSCCSGESFFLDVYKCVACAFKIHIRCALLPKNTRHKFDRHPLELIMTTHRTTDHDQLFCEFCEEEIELKLWYYGCHICEQYFHINCIPSVGLLHKVKFGKTYDDRRLHEHPLALTRMLTHGFHERCGVCQEIIEGFAEGEMAFHCSTCHLWIHFSCASATTTGLLDYLQYQQQLEQFQRDVMRLLRADLDRHV